MKNVFTYFSENQKIIGENYLQLALQLHDHVGKVSAACGFRNLLAYSTLFLTLGGLFFLGFGGIFGVALLTFPAFVSEPCVGIYMHPFS